VTSLAYTETGSGQPVLFIAGTGGAGRTWHIHQVPAFTAAGYRCITFDNRGIGATEDASGFSTDEMVADTAELIETVVGAPARLVAMSMGAFIAQELMLSRPELLTQVVLMGTRGRLDDTRTAFRAADLELADSGIELPAGYAAKVRVLETFSAPAHGRLAGPDDRRAHGEPAARLPIDHHRGAGDRIRRRRHHPAGAGPGGR
jgi:pimeloyl-ACP methyl ester carboxylesterase